MKHIKLFEAYHSFGPDFAEDKIAGAAVSRIETKKGFENIYLSTAESI